MPAILLFCVLLIAACSLVVLLPIVLTIIAALILAVAVVTLLRLLVGDMTKFLKFIPKFLFLKRVSILFVFIILSAGCSKAPQWLSVPFIKHSQVDSQSYCQGLESVDSKAFDFDRNIIDDFEGREKTLYVPADFSGPTIGYGLDLAAASHNTIEDVFRGVLSQEQIDTALTAHGKHGISAERWVGQHRTFVLTDCQLDEIELRQYAWYWKHLSSGREWLNKEPREIKTALLSFDMHLGNIKPLTSYIDRKDWSGLADRIEHYNDSMNGDQAINWKRRRGLEARLIRLSIQHNDSINTD